MVYGLVYHIAYVFFSHSSIPQIFMDLSLRYVVKVPKFHSWTKIGFGNDYSKHNLFSLKIVFTWYFITVHDKTKMIDDDRGDRG